MELPTSNILKQSIESYDTTEHLTNAARQRDARNLTSFPIVDVDCHHYENESLAEIVEYFDDPVMQQIGQLYTAGRVQGATPLQPGSVGYQRHSSVVAMDGPDGGRLYLSVPDPDADHRHPSPSRSRVGADQGL
jgi:hypothetical protein